MIIIYCDNCKKKIYCYDSHDYEEEYKFWWTDGRKHLCDECRTKDERRAKEKEEGG